LHDRRRLIGGLVDRPNNEGDLRHGTASAAVRISQLDNQLFVTSSKACARMCHGIDF